MEHESSHKRKPATTTDVDPPDDHHIPKRPRIASHARLRRYRSPEPLAIKPPSPPPPLKDVYIPPLVPSINYAALHDLDLECILRNPQLRHDLLFDPHLQFRQNLCRRRQLLLDRYWHAISHELNSGCACTAYDALTGVLRPTACHSHTGGRHPANRATTASRDLAHCGSSLTRLVPMLKEFKKVLENVIAPPPLPGSPSASASPSSGSPSSGVRHQHPTYLHSVAEVRAITDHVDLELMAREMRMGLYEPEGLVTLLGATLKRYCAPMRDGIVERMVQGGKKPTKDLCETWEKGERQARTVRTFRMCFDLLEVMKLDIANHQVQQIRPFLLKTTPEFELRFFLDKCKRCLPIHAPLFLRRGLLDITHSPSTPLLTVIHTTLLSSFTYLIFAPPSQPCRFPETLSLDMKRLQLLINDAADLMAVYMLLLLWRQLVFFPDDTATMPGGEGGGSLGGPNARLENWEVERMKRELWDVGPKGRFRIGQCFLWEEKDAANVTERKEWEESMEGVVVQVVVRAEEARERLRRRARRTAAKVRPLSDMASSASEPRRVQAPRLRVLLPPFSPLAPSSSFAASFAYFPPSPSTPSSANKPSQLTSHLPLPSAPSLSLLRGWIKSQLGRSSPLARKMLDLLRREVTSVAARLLQAPINPAISGPPAGSTQGFDFLNPYQVVHILPGQGVNPHPGVVAPPTPTSSSCPSFTSISSPSPSLPSFYFNFPTPATKTPRVIAPLRSKVRTITVAMTPPPPRAPPPPSANESNEGNVGLEPLRPEIQHLSARLAKMVALHEKVYWRVYECAGWVDWEGLRVKQEED